MKRWIVYLLLCADFYFLPAYGQENNEKDDARPSVSGYAQIIYSQYLKNQEHDRQSGFDINRVRFAFEGSVLPDRVHYAVEFDPQGSPILDDTYLDFMISKNSKVRLGRYKIPFGAENPTGEDELNFIEKSKVVESVFSAREVGIGTYYERNWIVGDVGYFQKSEDEHIERDVIGRIGFKPFGKYIETGGSGYYEKIHTDSTNFAIHRIGADLTCEVGPIKMQGEYIRSKGTMEDKHLSGYGYYGYGQYTHHIGDTQISWGVRYEFYQPDKNNKSDQERKYVVGSTIAFHPRMRAQVNFQHIRENIETNNQGQNKLIVQYQFSF